MSEKPAISASKQKRDKLREFVSQIDCMYCEDIPGGVIDGILELAPEMLDALDEAEILAAQFENTANSLDERGQQIASISRHANDLHGQARGFRIAARYIRERVFGEGFVDTLEDCPSCGAGACTAPGEVCAECKREGVKK